MALVGEIQKSKDMLIKAKKAAESVSEIDDLFCVADFQFQPKAIFLAHNQMMVEALDRGELWDGMKLPQEVLTPNYEIFLGQAPYPSLKTLPF